MTTVPLDEPADPRLDAEAAGPAPGRTPPADASEAEARTFDPEPPVEAFTQAKPWWSNDEPAPSDLAARLATNPFVHPIRWWERSGHRFLPGASFPIAAWAVWRLVQLRLSVFLGGSAVETLFNYDGERYKLIMLQGYANPHAEMPNTAFFPMVSWVSTPIYHITRNEALTAHVVASLTAIGALIAVWGVAREWKGEHIARRAVLLMLLFPSSMFLWAFYSEGLFIMLGAGAVWADMRRHRGLATALFVALAATRSVGVLIPAALVVAHIVRNGLPPREVLKNWWAQLGVGVMIASFVGFTIAANPTNAKPMLLLAAPGALVFVAWAAIERRFDRWCFFYMVASAVGLAAVMIVMWKQAGDPLAWLKVQVDWGRGIDNPLAALRQGWDNLYPTPDTVMIPALVARNLDLWCLPIVAFPIIYAAFSKKDRYPMEAWMLGVALIFVPLYSSALASFNRFVMADWVIYPVYASAIGRFHGRIRAGFYLAGVAAVGFVARVAESPKFEIQPWMAAIPPWVYLVAVVWCLVLAAYRWTISIHTAAWLTAFGLCWWVTYLMVGRYSVDRFVG